MPNYLGYPSHTDWLAAVDRSQPVNAICIIEPGRSAVHGLSLNKQLVILSQAQGSTIHYLRLIVDGYQTMDGRSALMDDKKHEQRAESAWKIIQTWLKEQGLTFRIALLAFPKTLRLLDGSADALMEFNKDLDRWLFADRIDPCLLEPSVGAQVGAQHAAPAAVPSTGA